jgi:hypothetical protein
MDKKKIQKKVKKVLGEFSEGTLHAGSKKDPLVKDKRVALAIGFAEGRKAKK